MAHIDEFKNQFTVNACERNRRTVGSSGGAMLLRWALVVLLCAGADGVTDDEDLPKCLTSKDCGDVVTVGVQGKW